MAAPNIVNVTAITGKTAVQAVGTSAADIVANAGSSGTLVKLNSLAVANIHASNVVSITVSVYRGSTEYKLAHAVSIPVGATLMAIDKSSQVYLEEGDSLRLTGSAATSMHAVCSYEVLS